MQVFSQSCLPSSPEAPDGEKPKQEQCETGSGQGQLVSMRFGYEQGQRNRLVSLGALLQGLGYSPKGRLRAHFEQNWLDEVVRKLILGPP